jgi:hypothetical protein
LVNQTITEGGSNHTLALWHVLWRYTARRETAVFGGAASSALSIRSPALLSRSQCLEWINRIALIVC